MTAEVVSTECGQTEPVDCTFCGSPVPIARTVELGYRHCTAPNCVAQWRHKQSEGFRLDLLPKVGFAISLRDDPSATTIGRSSGRSV